MAKLLTTLALLGSVSASPLWDFVNKPTPEYEWSYTGYNISAIGWDAYLLNVTSGSWLTPGDSNIHIWYHQVLVVVPWTIRFPDKAAIWITGGEQNDSPPKDLDEDVLVCASLSTSAGTVCSVVYQIPNQPAYFTQDKLHKRRIEDGNVAFTWYTYMTNSSATPDWILYFPMVRGAIKAMDATTEFVKTLNPALQLAEWMTMGASKRGWTTWLTGVVDKRIIAIVPVVMDALNFQETIKHMWMTLGNWTFAFTDYLEMGVPAYFGTPLVDKLAEQIDPLNYAVNLTMPKLVIDATGDEFFQLQDDEFWWGKLPGETYRMMVDNAEHSMATGVFYVITGIEAFWWSILTNTPRPTFNWTIDPTDGSININTVGVQPDKVVMRFATTLSSERRDFRLLAGDTPANPCKYLPVGNGEACLQPIIWVGETIAPVGPGQYKLTQPLPPSGWRAFLAELYYPGPPGSNTTFKLTTQASVIPNTYPFPPCTGNGCMGGLV